MLHQHLAGIQNQARRIPVSKRWAAFDADGTLWPMDLGESFFKFEIERGLLPRLPQDPWVHYRSWKQSGFPQGAYLWLAQIHQGLPEKQVLQWSAEHLASYSGDVVFPEIREIFKTLRALDFQIRVITASIRWAIVPAAASLGIPSEHVWGVECEVLQGRIGLRSPSPITYREGKMLRWNSHFPIGSLVKPWLSAGNSPGDETLLKSASYPLVIRSAPEDHEMATPEDELAQLARRHSWPCLDLRPRSRKVAPTK